MTTEALEEVTVPFGIVEVDSCAAALPAKTAADRFESFILSFFRSRIRILVSRRVNVSSIGREDE